jgi:hypothetical protein
LIGLLLAGTGSGQSNAEISGTVRDIQGGVLPAPPSSRRMSRALSNSKDDASSPGPTEAETNFPENVRNIFDETGEWARSSFDHRQALILSGTYQPRRAKTFALGAGSTFEIRWEVFNALNRANFDLPNRIFGRIFSAKSPREMQIGAKLSF